VLVLGLVAEEEVGRKARISL